MKDPDGVDDGITQAVKNSLEGVVISAEEKILIAEHRREQLEILLSKWFQFRENLLVEVDTVSETIKIIGDRDE